MNTGRRELTVSFFFQIDEPVHFKNYMNLRDLKEGLTTFFVKDQVTPISGAAGLASPSQLPGSEAAAQDAAHRPQSTEFHSWTPERELRVIFTYHEALFLFPFSLTIEYCKNHSGLTGSGEIWPAGQFADPSQAKTPTRPNLNFS